MLPEVLGVDELELPEELGEELELSELGVELEPPDAPPEVLPEAEPEALPEGELDEPPELGVELELEESFFSVSLALLDEELDGVLLEGEVVDPAAEEDEGEDGVVEGEVAEPERLLEAPLPLLLSPAGWSQP